MAGGGLHSLASAVSRFNTDTVLVLLCPDMGQTRLARPPALARDLQETGTWDLQQTGTQTGGMSLAGSLTAPDSRRWAEPLVARHVTGPKVRRAR
jgi:hypothetical protein